MQIFYSGTLIVAIFHPPTTIPLQAMKNVASQLVYNLLKPTHVTTFLLSWKSSSIPPINHKTLHLGDGLSHYIITCHLADAKSNLQLIRLSRRHTLRSNVGLRALLKGPTAVGHNSDRTGNLASPVL